MTATAQMLERSGGIGEGKFTINDRVNIVFFDGSQHGTEHLAIADKNAADAGHFWNQRNWIGLPR